MAYFGQKTQSVATAGAIILLLPPAAFVKMMESWSWDDTEIPLVKNPSAICCQPPETATAYSSSSVTVALKAAKDKPRLTESFVLT